VTPHEYQSALPVIGPFGLVTLAVVVPWLFSWNLFSETWMLESARGTR
jgi:hypothetical protein